MAMEFGIKSGQPQKQRSALIIVGLFEGKKLTAPLEALNKASEDFIANILKRGDLDGKIGQTLMLYNVPNSLADRILIVGCGQERKLQEKDYKDILQSSVRAILDKGMTEAMSFLTELNIKNRDIHWRVKFAVEVVSDMLYRFDQYKSKKDSPRLRRMTFSVPTKRDLAVGERAIVEGQAVNHAVSFTKDLANQPPNVCNPEYLAEEARKLSKRLPAIQTAILERKDMEALGMGCLLAVAQGSHNAPKLITLAYHGGKKEGKPIVLVGKGVTFDSGGLNLKDTPNMIGMKYDMCGAATVMGVLQAVAELHLPLNVVGVIASVENMPSGTAFRPDDIMKSLSGQTVENGNTDAEGRLILCDALTYAERYNPECVIDIATLTGACITALGHVATGLLSNHQPLANELLDAGQKAYDRAWQLPLWDDYQSPLESKIADMSNVANASAGAGTITAACFLSRFTKKYNWAHLDVAGTACSFSGSDKGALGRPVPMLLQFMLDRV